MSTDNIKTENKTNVDANIINEIFMRNYGVIDENEQQQLKNATITVVGAGGVGGISLINLARMGIGNIQVIDMDSFDYSNLNRQMLSGVSRIGKLKAQCAAETLLDINPKLNINTINTKLTEENAKDIFAGSDAIIDATDNLVSRVIIHRTAQAMGIPSVWIAVSPPFRGGVMTFSHETPPYELVLQHPSYQQALTPEVCGQINRIKEQRAIKAVEHGALETWSQNYITGGAPWAVISPVANIVGILASFEVFKLCKQRSNLTPCYAPELIKVDLAQINMVQRQQAQGGSWDNAEL